jgi:hypothetical protein
VRTGRRWHLWRVVGSLIGIVLFAAAVWLIAAHANEASQAWAALEQPSPTALSVLLVVSVLLIPLSAAAQSLMLRRTSGVWVGMGEMSALVSVATLLNMLPMWPGAIGRIGYHKVVHGIPPMRAGIAVVSIRLIGLVMGAALLTVVWVWPAGAVAVWFAVLFGLMTVGVWPSMRLVAWVIIIRWVDLLCTAVRYAAAFSLLHVDLQSAGAAAMAGTGEVASSVPFIGSGPGLREWSIGWMADRISHLPDALVVGVMADLLVRIATLVVTLPLGLLAFRWLSRRLQSSAGSIPRSRTVNSDSKA